MAQTFYFPDTVPELSGGSVCLRELTEDDIPGWFELHRERFRRQQAIRWAIVLQGSSESAIPELNDTFYGMTEFRIEDPDGRHLWIGQEGRSGVW